jgi:hypothetical protein
LVRAPIDDAPAPADDDDDIDAECAVCMLPFEDPVQLAPTCTHVFCRLCLVTYLGDRSTRPCPLCRRPYTRAQIGSATSSAAHAAASAATVAELPAAMAASLRSARVAFGAETAATAELHRRTRRRLGVTAVGLQLLAACVHVETCVNRVGPFMPGDIWGWVVLFLVNITAFTIVSIALADIMIQRWWPQRLDPTLHRSVLTYVIDGAAMFLAAVSTLGMAAAGLPPGISAWGWIGIHCAWMGASLAVHIIISLVHTVHGGLGWCDLGDARELGFSVELVAALDVGRTVSFLSFPLEFVVGAMVINSSVAKHDSWIVVGCICIGVAVLRGAISAGFLALGLRRRARASANAHADETLRPRRRYIVSNVLVLASVALSIIVFALSMVSSGNNNKISSSSQQIGAGFNFGIYCFGGLTAVLYGRRQR